MNIAEIKSDKKIRVILSGGGTAGHIYPAIALAQKIKEFYQEDAEILFVGAKGKMEMTKVAELGYNIIGLPISGLVRKLTPKNLLLPLKIAVSLYKARRIINKFKPQIVVGFGGYASTPIIKAAQTRSIPTMIWEGNSYSGMANRVLARSVQRVFVAYEGMERFYSPEKIVLSGNPLRNNFTNLAAKSQEAFNYFGFDKARPTLLITGGSLGARVFNEAMLNHFDELIAQKKINVIWQTGSFSYDKIAELINGKDHPNIWISAFINRMDLAYSLADVAVGRAGASTLSEVALVGMPSIIVPSPNVAEDHQRKNAISLVEMGAVVMVEDSDAAESLIPTALELLFDDVKLGDLAIKVREFAREDAADTMLEEMKKFIIV